MCQLTRPASYLDHSDNTVGCHLRMIHVLSPRGFVPGSYFSGHGIIIGCQGEWRFLMQARNLPMECGDKNVSSYIQAAGLLLIFALQRALHY